MKTYLKGVLITLLGVMILTPDSLLIRLIDSESASVNFWRGVFVTISVLSYLVVIEKVRLWHQLKIFNRYDYLGVLFFAMGSLTFVYAINNNNVAITLVLLSTASFFAAIFSYFFLREPVSFSMLIGIIYCFIGIFVMVSDSVFASESTSSFSWLAFFSALLCALSFAANLSLSRSGKQTHTILSFGLSGIPIAFISVLFATDIWLRPEVWLWMAIDGLLVIPMSFMLMLIGARYIPAPYSTMMIQLETFLGPLWVWLVLEEYPGISTFIGGSIIITTLIVVNLIKLKSQ